MACRRGYSRIEVAVLLLIVFFVAAMILSLARKAAESAARMSCQNNLKQIGIATLNHHDANQSLPALTALDPKTGANPGAPSMFWNLMPYIESGPRLYRLDQPTLAKYNSHSSVVFRYSWKDIKEHTQHGGDANQRYKPFLDPADATARDLRDVPMTLPDGTTGHYAAASYAANGLLPWGVKEQPNEALSANVILFAERPQVCRTAGGETVYNLWGVGFYSPHMSSFATITPAEPPGLLPTGQLAAHAEGVNPIQLITRNNACDPRLPGTPHRGGMQVAMGDGSVRVFSLNTDSQVFWAACAPPKR